MARKTSQARINKAKGRKGQQEVRDMLLEAFPALSAADVRSTSMGASGSDIALSQAAMELIPYDIEVKRKKTIAAVRFMEQASTHGELTPIAVFREDRGKWYCMLEFEDFLALHKQALK